MQVTRSAGAGSRRFSMASLILAISRCSPSRCVPPTISRSARHAWSIASLPASCRSGTRRAAGPRRKQPVPSPGPSPTPPGRTTAPASPMPASISRHSMRSMRCGRLAATASMGCSIRASRCGKRSPASPAAAGRCRSCRAGSCASPAMRRALCPSPCSAPATSSVAASASNTSCRERTLRTR